VTAAADVRPRTVPLLLFNGECAVCRRIAAWVKTSAAGGNGRPEIVERAIGDDPDALRAVNPDLDIWDAYETIHVVMPDGSMRVGGEAVAEVLRCLPNCRWFAWSFAVGAWGVRPFQLILNAGYTILADIRPLLGCESCGTPSPWVRFLRSSLSFARETSRTRGRPASAPHFTLSPSPRAHRVRASVEPNGTIPPNPA
jgi:predicted DCC family thiol-disulfide oxidoreductase YuxK